MKKNKIAIFVEGQTELIFVREMLLKVFEYENIHLECFTLFNDHNFHPTEYAYPNNEADNYYQIINVGNDVSVLSRILKREQLLVNSNFNKIIGLRDMYSKQYRDNCVGKIVNKEIIEKFKKAHKDQIVNKNIFFHFAIMEIESWIIAMFQIFEKMQNEKTIDEICEHLSLDLSSVDPELVLFKPSDDLDKIMHHIGKNGYDKSKGEVNSLVSYFEKQDFFNLYASEKCQSFTEFYDSLIN